MTSRTGCCQKYYTTRKYDKSGNVTWSKDYFQGVPISPAGTIGNADWVTQAALQTCTYSNGSSGVGATLTSTTNTALTLTSGSPTTNQLVLVINQASPAQNGYYKVTNAGSVSVPWVMTRSTLFDTPAKMAPNSTISASVPQQTWQLTTTGTITIGTTALNWFQLTGSYNLNVYAQAIDGSRVYVGGDRVQATQTHQWSIVCFDIETGQVLWDYDCGGAVWKIQVDSSTGKIVCMIKNDSMTPGGYFGTTLFTHVFKRLTTSGTLDATKTFTQQVSPTLGGSTPTVGMDFCINESSDWHILGLRLTSNLASIYEWTSPQSGSPTLREMPWTCGDPISIKRIGGRDWISLYASGENNYTSDVVLKGKAQSAAPYQASDFDLRIPSFISLVSQKTVQLVAPTGTTQGTALALSVGNSYIVNPQFIVNDAQNGVSLDPYTYSNGTGGVGATLTSTAAPGAGTPFQLNGSTTWGSLGNNLHTFLIKDETPAKYNGIYLLTLGGGGGIDPWVLTRIAGFDSSSSIHYGSPVSPSAGPLAGQTWAQSNTNSTIAVGTDAISFAGGANLGGSGVTLPGSGGCILPTGSAGDVIPFNQNVNIGTLIQATAYNLYPPSGGTINAGSVNAPVTLNSGDYAVCVSAGNWYLYSYLVTLTTFEVDVDGSSNIVGSMGGEHTQLLTSGLMNWQEYGSSESICVDSDGTAFFASANETASSNRTLVSREQGGYFRFSHQHAGVGEQKIIQYDASESAPIQTGQRQDPTTDQWFLPDPTASPACGRSATASKSGIGGNYTVGFSTLGDGGGLAPQSGTVLIAILADNSNIGSSLAISGGATWTKIGTGGTTGYKSCSVWKHVCGGSEPLTYTVTYGGTASTDSASCTIVEAFNLSSTQPDGTGTGSNSASSPTATSANATDVCVTLVASFAGTSTTCNGPPSGYMLRGRSQSTAATPVTTAIAVRNEVGAASISPGNWPTPDTTNSYLWTLTLKP